MNRRITNDEYLSLALRYNEQRAINDSLQREITELEEKNEIRMKQIKMCITKIHELEIELYGFRVDEELENGEQQ